MTWLYILLGILLFLSLALFFPVKLNAEFNGEWRVEIKYLFFTLYRYPESKRKKKKKNRTKEKPAPKKSEKRKSSSAKSAVNLKKLLKKKGISGFIEAIQTIAGYTSDVSRHFFKHLYFKTLEINITAAEEDAAETAVSYGKICSLVYPSLGIFLSNTKYKKANVIIKPDFQKTETTVYSFIESRIRTAFVLTTAIKAIIAVIKGYLILTDTSEENDK